MTETVYLAVYDTLADWETGHATAAINRPLWHKDPGRFQVRTVGPSTEPITTLGGMRVLPHIAIGDLEARDAAMLILPGNDIWMTDAYAPFLDKARDFLDAGTPVAAICGATGGLARVGLLDDRAHTSNALEFLRSIPDYRGADNYVDEPAVLDGDLITATATRPADFAAKIIERLGLYDPAVLASWRKLYVDNDPSGFYELAAV